MSLQLITPEPQHAPELGRICYEAFGTLHDRHSAPRDFHAREVAEMVISMLIARDDFYGVAAMLDGKLVGSNFIALTDEVAGVGPITVDPACQGAGVGRALMQHVIDFACRRDLVHVRLFQEAINTASLSLYTSLGFVWRDAAASMDSPEPRDDDAADPAVRPFTTDDLPAADQLSRRVYGFSRVNEVAAALAHGFPTFVIERDGRITGYRIVTIFGHGMMENESDAVRLILGSSARVDPGMRRFLCPLSQPRLYRQLLDAGCRTAKIVNYMSLEAYHPPGDGSGGAWLPSIGC